MIKAGFFSATKTLRRILASSGSRDIISRRSSWAGFRIMAAWSFWASFALIWNRNKPAKTTWSVTWFSNGQFSKTNTPLKKTQIPPLPTPCVHTRSSRDWDTPFRAVGTGAAGFWGTVKSGGDVCPVLSATLSSFFRTRETRAFSIWEHRTTEQYHQT